MLRHAGVAAVLAAAGLLFATSALTSGGTDLRSEAADLGSLVAQRSQENSERATRVSALRSEVDALSRDAQQPLGGDAGEDPLADPGLGTASGALAVTGPGLTVTLDDAPTEEPRPAGATPDDLVVHQQDVEAVVNALWAGGAEAMVIMDQRIVATSAVRCVGNVLVLQGRTYSPPYRISAIGDVDRLHAALDDSAEVSIYQQYVAAYGLGYQVSDVDDLQVPAFDGTTRATYARVPATGGGR
ncbi:DUF881 domain-containing protein [Kineococcus sp. SYSU DK003]|uniref:DUF881 domain-containing protein n=1 Tax=Kineococcus sp. SYSU DK003 TaxID=3383124 RepID=UPI003D7E315D